MSHRYLEEQLVRPRVECGVNFGVPRLVLVQMEQGEAPVGDVQLLFQPGHKHWNGRGEPRAYSPARLVLLDRRGSLEHGYPLGTEITAGGPLRKQLVQAAAKIREVFGIGIEPIRRNQTLVVEPPAVPDCETEQV